MVYPGDVGSVDERGLVTIAGRTSELISLGRAIVAPKYVEEVMMTIGGLRDIGVFGVVNADGMEEMGSDRCVARAGRSRSCSRGYREAGRQGAEPDHRGQSHPRNQMYKVKRAELRASVLASVSGPAA